MTRVYAIRTGSYSDTDWGPVFSTIEKALAHKMSYRGSECEVEVHVLDDENDTGPVFVSWLIVFDSGGNVIHHTQEDKAEPYEPLIHDEEIAVFPPMPGNHWYYLDAKGVRARAALIVRSIRALDLAHAVKIANDKRAEYLAAH